ncbi:MAG TPA: hypothetical protein PK659_09335 [Methanothrix sp.]|nr:hypothetical protein [Methanothrix sp.]HOL44441.1 hypothetical protein [Methanothrix sp.]
MKFKRKLVHDGPNHKMYVPAMIALAWIEENVCELDVEYRPDTNSIVVKPIARASKNEGEEGEGGVVS